MPKRTSGTPSAIRIWFTPPAPNSSWWIEGVPGARAGALARVPVRGLLVPEVVRHQAVTMAKAAIGWGGSNRPR
ncbi:hypothetical protein [Dactylosporangium darangshiense]|uniref:hypothetical protein n=1 Tax=Dactylosporangium darangshiense TaxID=579108 RepID=UPI0036352696